MEAYADRINEFGKITFKNSHFIFIPHINVVVDYTYIVMKRWNYIINVEQDLRDITSWTIIALNAVLSSYNLVHVRVVLRTIIMNEYSTAYRVYQSECKPLGTIQSLHSLT